MRTHPEGFRTTTRRWVTAVSMVAVIGSSMAWPGRASAAQWDPEWEAVAGRSADAVATDASGDVYVAGTVRSADAAWRSMVLVKYAADGEQLWRRRWLGTAGFPYSVGRDVAVAPDGASVYVAGGELNDSTEHARATVWAYSADDGTLMWRRAMWPHSSSVAEGIGAGPSGPVVGVAGRSEYPLLGDGRVAAFGMDGARSWTAPFEIPTVRRQTDDAVFDVDVDTGGRVFVVGAVERRRVTIDQWWDGRWSDVDVAIQRYDSEGQLMRSTLLADPGTKDRDAGLAIDVFDRMVMVAGLEGATRAGGGHAWIARATLRGHVVWSSRAGARPSVASGVALTPWGDVQLVGRTGAGPKRLFVRAYSPDGVLESRRHLDHAGASGVAASEDPAIYVVGGRTVWRLAP
jgi:hypothetical protein